MPTVFKPATPRLPVSACFKCEKAKSTMSLNVTAVAATFMNVVGYASMSLAGMNTTLGCPCTPEANKLCNELIETFEQQLGECQEDMALKKYGFELYKLKFGECQDKLVEEKKLTSHMIKVVYDRNATCQNKTHTSDDQWKDAIIFVLLALLVFPRLAKIGKGVQRVANCTFTVMGFCLTVIKTAVVWSALFAFLLWAATQSVLVGQRFLASSEGKFLVKMLWSEIGVVAFQIVSAAVSTYAKNMFGPFYGFCNLLLSEFSRSAWAELLQLE